MTHRFALSAAFPRILFLAALLFPLTVLGDEDEWLLVDTDNHTLQLFDGERRVLQFEGISIGRGGAGHYRLKGDERTPRGKFRVAWLNPESRYRFFIGLNYPQRAHAKRALKNGDIDAADQKRIYRAIYAGRLPPQNTPLGGQIGIHGLGRADPGLHEMADWTRGCVAVTNEQIDLLRRHVYIGMAVVIR
jgi:murein L,D-transpeptidase YafK